MVTFSDMLTAAALRAAVAEGGTNLGNLDHTGTGKDLPGELDKARVSGQVQEVLTAVLTADRDAMRKMIPGAGTHGPAIEIGRPHTWRGGDYSVGSRFSVVCLGDSNTYGTGIVAESELWPSRLRNELRRTFGDGGLGFYGMWRTDVWTTFGTTTAMQPDANGDPTPDTTPAAHAPWGFGRFFNSNPNGVIFTKPAGATVTTFDLFYIDDSAGVAQNADISFDGGVTWQLNALSMSGTGDDLKRITINQPITSTLRIRGVNAFNTFIVGIAIYNGTGGVVVHNLGRGGVALRDIADTIANNGAASGATNDDRLRILDYLCLSTSSLVVANLGENDLTYLPTGNVEALDPVNPTPVATYQTMWDRLATRTDGAAADLVIMQPQDVDPASLIVKYYPTSGGVAYLPGGYADAARAVAESHNRSFLSMRDLLGSYATATANGFMADSFHLNATGQKLLTGYLSQLLRVA